MKPRFPSAPRLWLSVFVLYVCITTGAFADEQRVEVLRNGVQTTLILPEYTSQGVPYASLRDLARQIGGSVEVGDARAVLRVGTQSIEAGLEDDEARAGTATIALRHPVRSYNGDALIAIDDLVPVLRAGFGFGTPESPPVTSALSLDSVEPDLESIDSAVEAMESVSLESIAGTAPAPADREVAARPLDAPAFGDASGFLLAIDPGHGGDDTGVVGPGGRLEKDVCLAVAAELRRVLKEDYGIATLATREKDEIQGMKGRRQALSGSRVNLVLSLHSGANPSVAAKGPVLFAHTPSQTLSVDSKPGLQVARVLAGTLNGVTDAGVVPVYEVPLILLRGVDVPGVLVELGNLNNPEDAARLGEAGYQARLASALAAGIDQLLERPAASEVAP